MSTLHTSNDHAHAAHGHDAHGHGDHAKYPFLQHHFDTPAHQFDSAKLGMWLFLATEVLFFGGLFVAYAILRMRHPEVFSYASHYLNTLMGGVNTCVLILSSLTMAMAVRFAQTNRKNAMLVCLVLTFAGACGFMVIKYFEYSHKIHEHLVWGKTFYVPPHTEEGEHEAKELAKAPEATTTLTVANPAAPALAPALPVSQRIANHVRAGQDCAGLILIEVKPLGSQITQLGAGGAVKPDRHQQALLDQLSR